MQQGGGEDLHTAMMRSQMAKEGGKGGVMSTVEAVKGVDSSVVSAVTGNVDQLGQACSGAMGLLAGNVCEGMLKMSDLSIFNLSPIIDQAKGVQSELAERVNSIMEKMRLEGVTAPEPQSPALQLSPEYTPSVGRSHGPEHGGGIDM